VCVCVYVCMYVYIYIYERGREREKISRVPGKSIFFPLVELRPDFWPLPALTGLRDHTH
jgi:hypothetical protein